MAISSPGWSSCLDRSAVSPRGHSVLGVPGPTAPDKRARRDLSCGPEWPRAAVADDLAASPATLQAALGLTANAVATWIVRGELPALEGKVQTLDLSSWKAEAHTLVRLPYCPACGGRVGAETDSGALQPLVLESRLKAVSRDNGYRVVVPEVTLKRYGHHVSPITGAVSMLERVGPAADTELGSANDGTMPVHVYIAGQNLARRHRSLADLRGDL